MHPIPSDSNQKSKGCPPRAGFLLEELIGDDDNRNFIKYIHNMDCNPLLDEDEFGYDIAAFLACTQHIQYVKTGGLAFILDYQGATQILILKNSSLVNQGKDTFGDGNIENEVSMFEKKHVCNDYCTWSGFGLARLPAVLEEPEASQ
ncbi:hypothetical protein EV424DRAFT_1326870 [Suillus variegatus]|nr:hypothetical protein EV424DRAFT_1326870 [Suillus variegatus]